MNKMVGTGVADVATTAERRAAKLGLTPYVDIGKVPDTNVSRMIPGSKAPTQTLQEARAARFAKNRA